MQNKEISLNKKRTKYCGEFNQKDLNQKVGVMGWVEKQRDLGNLVFLDLRDRTGVVQLAVFKEQKTQKAFENAQICRAEFVVFAKGTVLKRKEKNPKIKTGEIEILVDQLEIISKSKTPPFEIFKSNETSLDLTLKYRYLELRNKDMQKTFLLRHKINKKTRDFFSDNGFLEIETPILVKSTPEGARDYLVPSRVHKGKFYALPQSPQIYKQLLMVAGFDRYFQIARCFRDEDLRADRQPEFSQLDLEMSFANQEDVISINEEYVKYLFSEILKIKIKTPFLRLSYKQALENYGSDKPDLRFDLKIVCLNEILKNSNLKIFKSAIAENGGVFAINLKNKADLVSRKEIDKLTELAKTYKAKGLFFSKAFLDSSNYEKFLEKEEIELIYKKLDAKTNDLILIIADPFKETALLSLGALRVFLAKKFNLFKKDEFCFAWVVDFPLFEYSEEEKRYVSKHHPFTAVSEKDLQFLNTNPEKCHAKAYDLILNGCEIGGGSVRIHNQEIQNNVFKALKLSDSEIKEKFGFLIEAFKFGAPPHAGMAYGLDRLIMIMLKKTSIREVIAFPKLQNASEPLTNSPSEVEKNQLENLNIILTNHKTIHLS